MRFVNLRNSAILLLVFGGALAAWVLICGHYFSGDYQIPDSEKADKIGKFISALVVPLFSLGGALLVIENLRASTLQNFVNNFFKLLDFHHKFADNIKDEVDFITTEEVPSIGRAFFDDLSWRIAIDFAFLNNRNMGNDPMDVEQDYPRERQVTVDTALLALNLNADIDQVLLVKIYNHYYHIHQSVLGQYFTHLYHVVHFVDTHSKLSLAEKKTYVKMLRAQLSNYEVLILAYNCMHPYGAKFKELVEKYEMLDNLNNENRVPPTRRKRIIDPLIIESAFPHLRKKEWASS